MACEYCNECGRSVTGGSSLFVDRVPDFDSEEIRIANSKPYPKGDYLCRECEEKIERGEL